LTGRADQGGVAFFMDSGANETMIKNKNLFESLDPRQTLISTATGQKGAAKGVFGTPKAFSFSGTNRRVCFGKEGKGVWCEQLNDNLLSVGRLCDAGFSVVFNSQSCSVFSGEKVHGKPIYQSPRDSDTGLYPVFLNECKGDCRPMRLPGDRGGVNGASDTKSDISIVDLRKHFGTLSEWASAKLTEDRGAKSPWLKNTFANFVHSLSSGKLARFYIPSTLSNFQRWHEKLGHPGRKILMRCHIPGLIVPKNIPVCDACTKGKMHKLGPVSSTSVKQSRFSSR